MADWDVDSYRMDHESDEHWELRRNFMLAHKDKLTEDETVCMAQVFTNIELMGCRYPDKTMIRVSELAKGVVEEFRERKKDSLKRTFVAASDAASAKVKGLHRSAENTRCGGQGKRNKPIQFVPSGADVGACPDTTGTVSSPAFQTLSVTHSTGGRGPWPPDRPAPGAPHTPATVAVPPGPLGDFVLFLGESERLDIGTLQRSVSMNKAVMRVELLPAADNSKRCNVFIREHLVGSGLGANLKAAKKAAAVAALQHLQDNCYYVKIKAQFFSKLEVDAAALKGAPQGGESKAASEELGEDNIGKKMLRLMGWGGGGLGSKGQGIAQPVGLAVQRDRVGLGHQGPPWAKGHSTERDFKEKARRYIKLWMASDTSQDLVFSSEFSNEERKTMHQIAAGLQVQSKSFGKGEDRKLVIYKRQSPWTIVQELSALGGASEKYELICPPTVARS